MTVHPYNPDEDAELSHEQDELPPGTDPEPDMVADEDDDDG